MAMYGGGDNKEKLMARESELDRLTSDVTRRLENISGNIEDLEDYEEKLGTSADTKNFRGKLREKIDETQKEIRATLDAIKGIEGLDVKSRSDQETKLKMAKRFTEIFNKHKESFTNVLKQINTKEKVYVDQMKGSTLQKSSDVTGSRGESHKNEELAGQIQEIAFAEEIINDRDQDIKKVETAINLMNDINKTQALEIKSQGDGLDIVIGNITSTKDNVQKANKELESANKYEKDSTRRNLYICLIVVALVAGVLVVTLMVTKF